MIWRAKVEAVVRWGGRMHYGWCLAVSKINTLRVDNVTLENGLKIRLYQVRRIISYGRDIFLVTRKNLTVRIRKNNPSGKRTILRRIALLGTSVLSRWRIKRTNCLKRRFRQRRNVAMWNTLSTLRSPRYIVLLSVTVRPWWSSRCASRVVVCCKSWVAILSLRYRRCWQMEHVPLQHQLFHPSSIYASWREPPRLIQKKEYTCKSIQSWNERSWVKGVNNMSVSPVRVHRKWAGSFSNIGCRNRETYREDEDDIILNAPKCIMNIQGRKTGADHFCTQNLHNDVDRT